MRDRTIDICKGIAILFVYLGHSVIYHPINLMEEYDWCVWFHKFITSFNMPVFFIISGYLFSFSKKNNKELFKAKTRRLFIPYLSTMAIVGVAKFVLPSLSYGFAGDVRSFLIDVFVYGGDRWFVYTLFLMSLFFIPFRRYLINKIINVLFIIFFLLVWAMGIAPDAFKLDALVEFSVFFLIGYLVKDYYACIKTMIKRYYWAILVLFLLFNVLFVNTLYEIKPLFRFVMPLIGTCFIFGTSDKCSSFSKNCIVQYMEYCGKYSLQFYLFSFAYPVIRVLVVSKLHIYNPYYIIASVFILQLVCITAFVEITRRIKLLRVPLGYY